MPDVTSYRHLKYINTNYFKENYYILSKSELLALPNDVEYSSANQYVITIKDLKSISCDYSNSIIYEDRRQMISINLMNFILTTRFDYLKRTGQIKSKPIVLGDLYEDIMLYYKNRSVEETVDILSREKYHEYRDLCKTYSKLVIPVGFRYCWTFIIIEFVPFCRAFLYNMAVEHPVLYRGEINWQPPVVSGLVERIQTIAVGFISRVFNTHFQVIRIERPVIKLDHALGAFHCIYFCEKHLTGERAFYRFEDEITQKYKHTIQDHALELNDFRPRRRVNKNPVTGKRAPKLKLKPKDSAVTLHFHRTRLLALKEELRRPVNWEEIKMRHLQRIGIKPLRTSLHKTAEESSSYKPGIMALNSESKARSRVRFRNEYDCTRIDNCNCTTVHYDFMDQKEA